MATGASDYMGYFHEKDLFTAAEVTPPLYWIPLPKLRLFFT